MDTFTPIITLLLSTIMAFMSFIAVVTMFFVMQHLVKDQFRHVIQSWTVFLVLAFLGGTFLAGHHIFGHSDGISEFLELLGNLGILLALLYSIYAMYNVRRFGKMFGKK